VSPGDGRLYETLGDPRPGPGSGDGGGYQPGPPYWPWPGSATAGTRPGRGPGRIMRVLTGVNEDILDWVPEERPRYTGLGVIVLGTAVMAALSMLDALTQIFGTSRILLPFLILIAVFWGSLICGIDRWLIASTHGGVTLSKGRRFGRFAPRIVLAALFGAIIAVPLLLTAFGPEVAQQAENLRSTDLIQYGSLLQECNPLSGSPGPRQVNCTGQELNVTNPTLDDGSVLQAKKTQEASLQNTLSQDTAKEDHLEQVVQEECDGVRSEETTGLFGAGPVCAADQSAANKFSNDHQLPALAHKVQVLGQEISDYQNKIKIDKENYDKSLTGAINAAVATRQSHQGQIGLLDRISALGSLASRSLVILVAAVALFLFIMTVDCLPVLSKMISGITAYDKLADARLEAGGEMAQKAFSVTRAESVGRSDISLYRIGQHVQANTRP
jgi:hypothetical protein